MAFVTATSLSIRGQAGSKARVCKLRMQDEVVGTEPIPPLNGEEEHPMKEIFPVAAGKKAPVCRCWQSNKFPLCDGSHNAFNKKTGSHVGPIVISATAEE